jgi:LysR family transcriptional regulator, glycine cleavage system transcriptional activator
MSRRRLPPLKAVRAFEAAARHRRFEQAGAELGVTAGAIAQQVKILETWLGLALFRRLPAKGVALTGAGERYAAAARDLLDGFAEATARLLRQDGGNTLTVSTMPSLAANWLIPRLGSLRRLHPQLDVRVQITPGLTDFAREDVDVAIRYGHGRYPGLRVDFLMEETFFPVCSAALLADPARPLSEPADLRHHTLLHEESEPGLLGILNWPQWLAAIGVTGIDVTRGPRFSHTFLALQAAASGQGVALATSVLIGGELDAGRLVRPFTQEVKGPYRYYLVCPEATANRRNVAAFREWLLAEIGLGPATATAAA